MDVILRPVPAGHDVCLWDPAEIDDCSPVVSPGGPGGGAVTWHGPVRTGRKSPWEKSHTLAPTHRPDPDAKKRLRKLQEADDLEVVRILATFLGHN